MPTSVVDQLGAVRRQVSTAERDGHEVKVVAVEQTYDADVADVWEACTDPQRLTRWLMPVSGDLRLGGRYQLEGNAGGEVLQCDAPEHLAVTWEYGPEVSWVDVRLSDAGDGRTTLRVEHAAQIRPEWGEYGPGAVGVGWDLMLLGLSRHLSSGGGVPPEQAAEWQVSDEARGFMTASSDAWGAASAAAGTPQDDARAAAERTTAFYTTPPSAT